MGGDLSRPLVFVTALLLAIALGGVVAPVATANSLELEARYEVDARLAFRAGCLLYTSPSPRDRQKSRMPSSA